MIVYGAIYESTDLGDFNGLDFTPKPGIEHILNRYKDSFIIQTGIAGVVCLCFKQVMARDSFINEFRNNGIEVFRVKDPIFVNYTDEQISRISSKYFKANKKKLEKERKNLRSF